MGSFFLHIGYPKTGTSTLQKNIFDKHSEIFSTRSEIEKHKKLREKICENKKVKNMPKILPEKESKRKVIVCSEERFTSNLKNDAPESIDRHKVAKRLFETFSRKNIEVEVIIVIRNQKSLLMSAFAFWYYDYKSMGIDSIDELIRKGTEKENVRAYNILSWLNYFSIIDAYRELFGSQNVHILLYERLSQDAESFVRRLSQIMGICEDESAWLLDSSVDRNVTKTDKVRRAPNKIYRWLSLFKSRYLPQVGSVRNYALGEQIVDWLQDGPQISMSKSSVSRLHRFYGDDNRRVETEFHLPLSEYGYLVS